MLTTYNTLKRSITKNWSNFTNEDLAQLYKYTDDTNEILAEIFCRNFSWWLTVAKRINCISSEDKASIILEQLNQSLLRFNKFKGSFLTFATASIYNAFGGIKTKNKFKNRQEESQSLSLERLICRDYKNMQESINEVTCDLETMMLKLSIRGDKLLTKSEKAYCELVIDNPNMPLAEISSAMNISSQYVWILRKNLRKKIKVSLCLQD